MIEMLTNGAQVVFRYCHLAKWDIVQKSGNINFLEIVFGNAVA